MSLFLEYGVTLCNVSDTGLADAALRLKNDKRSLDTVIKAYIDCDMTHKGAFVHVPGMFRERPLPPHFFVYAYEDVIHCNRLYLELRRQLIARELLEYVHMKSQQICPPLSAGYVTSCCSTFTVGRCSLRRKSRCLSSVIED